MTTKSFTEIAQEKKALLRKRGGGFGSSSSLCINEKYEVAVIGIQTSYGTYGNDTIYILRKDGELETILDEHFKSGRMFPTDISEDGTTVSYCVKDDNGNYHDKKYTIRPTVLSSTGKNVERTKYEQLREELLPGAERILQEGYSDRILQSEFSQLEKILVALEGRIEPRGVVISVLPGTFWGVKVYHNYDYRGLYKNAIPDLSRKARWVTQDVMDKDCMDEQRRITLWEDGDGTPKVLYEEHKYSREGTLPTPSELFERFK